MKATRSTAPCTLVFGALALMACDDANKGRAEVEFIVPEAPKVQTSRLYPGPCLRQRDSDIDGTINAETHYAYDVQDRQISSEHYLEGELDSTSQWSYDANGNIIEVVLTGLMVQTTHWTYNDQNKPIEVTRDAENDGTIDAVTVYSYDDTGLLTSRVNTQTDGITNTTTFTRDANGDTVAEHSKTEERDGSNTRCRDVFTEWDMYLEETLEDHDCDGMPESTQSITHNEDWLPVLHEQDLNADGIIDVRATYQYDARGNLIYQLNEFTDPRPSNAVNQSQFSSTTTTFTAAGKPLEVRTDFDNDGTIDRIDAYNYDSFGNPLTRLERGLTRQSFGRDAWTVYSYDCFDAEEDTP